MKIKIKKTMPFVLVVALLLTLLPGMALTAHGQDIVADAGTAPYPVSVNIVASTPNGAYNGVMVHLKVESGMDQLQMYGTGADTAPMRFVRGLSLPTGSSSYNDYNSDKDIWTCGFLYYAARNPITTESMTVGRLEFTYIGSEPVKITLLDMDLVRIVDFSDDYDILANCEREPIAPPVAEINITRANGPEGFVPVTDIIGVPTSATAGVPRTLTSTVVPADATNNDIIWTVKDVGTTGATIVSGNRLNTTAAGMAVLTATIVDGRGIGVDFVKDFAITVGSATFVAVEGISGLPSEAMVGEPLVLTGTVVPGDATNKTIEWDILDAGSTGATITGGNILNATSGGTVTISATVRGGMLNGMIDYVRNFSVTVKEPPIFIPVEDIIGLPTSTTAGSTLTLAGTVDPPDATNKTIIWAIKDTGATGATLTGNLLHTELVGYVTVTATVPNGLAVGVDYVKEFLIRVNDDGSLPPVLPVTNIIGVPTTIMEKVWTSLAGTVVPANATYQTIVWSVKDDGGVGAEINAAGQLLASAAGTVIVTATIVNGILIGKPYIQDFTIDVQSAAPPFVPVTGIIGVATLAEAGVPLALAGVVVPEDATNKAIVWSIKDPGTTGATITGNLLRTTAAGSLTVTATIANGEGEGIDFMKDCVIKVVPATSAVVVVSASPAASVEKLSGNQNRLTVTVTEKLSDGKTNLITATIMINNNAAGTYNVGTYKVYVDTKGNTQIRECRIVV
ncbi:MAG: hypothetical protein FWG42_04605 [Clostridiales bacterium]|nr:hypothetical protein [Clostridiales bacterium]